jgi:LPXTG-site transpeptidase (sortase) family protein
MLGRISARTGVRGNSAEAPGGEQTRRVKKAFASLLVWGRARRSTRPPHADEVAEDEATRSRFEPVRLSQVEMPGRRSLFAGRSSRAQALPIRGRFSRPGEAAEDKAEAGSKRKARAGAGRLFDRALLALEVAGALVIAWLAFQYIYTVYIDTGSRRLSGSSGNAVIAPQMGRATSTSTPTLLPTATRFAETLPPITGDGPGEDGEVATPGRATASPTGSVAHKSTATPAPTATVEPQLLLPSRLRIPAMFLDSPVHEVTLNLGEWEVSPMDIGHHAGTGNPGEAGNVVLAGHRDINSALFRELDRLKPGDEIFVSNGLGEYRYIVQESFEVSPDQVWVMEPSVDKRVTLITCTPLGLATRRLVVLAVMEESDT